LLVEVVAPLMVIHHIVVAAIVAVGTLIVIAMMWHDIVTCCCRCFQVVCALYARCCYLKFTLNIRNPQF